MNEERKLIMNELTETVVFNIKKYFEKTGGKTAIVGISGGKDSSVTAALCVKALGKENVIGVLMPNGEQKDIEDAYKICKFLDIKYYEFNIKNIFNEEIGEKLITLSEILPEIKTEEIIFALKSGFEKKFNVNFL